MNLTIRKAHQLTNALTALARGFPVNGETKPHPVKLPVSAKLAIARNLRRLREVLEPAEAELIAQRDRLMNDRRQEDPGAKELDSARADELQRFVRELNDTSAPVDLEQLKLSDLPLEELEGQEAIEVLSVLDEFLISDD